MNGRPGRPLVERALDAGHDVTASVRDASKHDIEHDALRVVDGDVTDAEAVSEAVAGVDIVLSTLGHTSSSTCATATAVGRASGPRVSETVPSTGEYETGYLKPGLRSSVSRADVASFMFHCAVTDQWVGEMPMVSH